MSAGNRAIVDAADENANTRKEYKFKLRKVN